MVVYDFDIRGANCAFRPFEANAPLVINPNAKLPQPGASKSLETVSRQPGKVHSARRCLQAVQFHPYSSLDSGESFYPFTRGEISGSLVPITDDQPSI